MAASYYTSSSSSPSITCELKIIGAKNIETKHKGNLFIRCYLLSVGTNNNTRIQRIRSQVFWDDSFSLECNGYIFWDDSFSLECNGTEDSISSLGEETVVFELRWRNKNSFLGKIGGGSQLLASAEVPWKNVFGSPKMELQRWVVMSVNEENNKLLKLKDGVKAPALQIAMKVEIPTVSTEEMMRKRRRRERLMKVDECGCKSSGECCSCADNELLLIGATLDDGF